MTSPTEETQQVATCPVLGENQSMPCSRPNGHEGQHSWEPGYKPEPEPISREQRSEEEKEKTEPPNMGMDNRTQAEKDRDEKNKANTEKK